MKVIFFFRILYMIQSEMTIIHDHRIINIMIWRSRHTIVYPETEAV